MLLELTVENLGAIERAEMTLGGGSTALTGETGAGKTLVVAALGLLLGGRADRVLVRSGAEGARVEGRFVLGGDHPVVARLRDEQVLAADAEDEVEIVVMRGVRATGGSSSARVNGRLVTASLLSEIGPHLADVAGQHEQARISKPGWQRLALDEFGGPEAKALALRVRDGVREVVRLERRMADLTSGERARSRELDVLRYEIAEIEAASPREGESAAIASELARVEHAETLAEGLTASAAQLGGDGGAQDLAADARARLARLTDLDPDLQELGDRLQSIEIEIADVASLLTERITAPDPQALEAMRERLAVLTRLERKYGEDEGQILSYLERSRARAEELAAVEDDLPGLQARLVELRADAENHAAELSGVRAEAGGRLAAEVEALLGQLAMDGARFKVALSPVRLHEGGLENVEFKVAANPGEEPRPLSRVASGGELSRIALALYLVAESGRAQTMVFDEVDAGVGGAAAQSVGRALSKLARAGAQVVVVTHLPQVAAFADTHLSVDKLEVNGRSSAVVRCVEGDDRVAELARMLAGLPESERGRDHARELLDLAAPRAAAP